MQPFPLLPFPTSASGVDAQSGVGSQTWKVLRLHVWGPLGDWGRAPLSPLPTVELDTSEKEAHGPSHFLRVTRPAVL